MSQSHPFRPLLSTAEEWLDQVRECLDLSVSETPRALRALRAGLHAIRDRLPLAEVADLGAQLPVLIRGLYYEGWSPANDPAAIRSREELVDRVARELAMDPQLEPIDALRAVIHLLVERVSPGEIRDVLATLPAPLVGLWQDLTGHAISSLP